MREMDRIRQKVKVAILVLLLVNVCAGAVLFSPLVGSARSRQQTLRSLELELQSKTREVEPLKDLDKKIDLAKGQISDFYKQRLPEQGSAISESLGKLASENGVQIGGLRYKLDDPLPVGLREVEIDGEFSGDYLQLVRFVNAVERNKMFYLIDSVDLGGEQNGVVKLQLKLETYLKVGTA